jgi:YfiH family protein
MVADCVPVVLHDPERGSIAVVHAGWKGTVKKIVAATVSAMVERGSDPGHILAAIGPAIAQDRYQVGPEVADAARATFGAGVLEDDGDSHWRFDLVGANRSLLEEAGVAHLDVPGIPTGGDFFSHRAERPCGRFAALARLR